MILSNQAECLHCGDKPYSAHVHDMSWCGCGMMAVDGGMEYLRRAGDPDSILEMSIEINDMDYELLKEAIEDDTKNTLGKVCNVARVLRDVFSINIGM